MSITPSHLQTKQLVHNQEFNHKEIIYSFVSEYSQTHGFRTVVTHSNSKAIYFICKSNEISTCPFSLVAYYSKLSNIWTLKVKNETHNHNLSSKPLMSVDFNVENEIISLHQQGYKPAYIEKKISTKSSTSISKKFIYDKIRNYKKRQKRLKLKST